MVLILLSFLLCCNFARASLPLELLDRINIGMQKQRFRVVVASRIETVEEVVLSSPVGISLNRFPPANMELVVYKNNTSGLSEVYNREIEYAKSYNSDAILIFVHDDLFILDYYWYRSIYIGLEYFDMIGLAGCARRLPFQSTWRSMCDAYESGSLLHSVDEKKSLLGESVSEVLPNSDTKDMDMHAYHALERKAQSYYGHAPQHAKLLDGVLLATYSNTLIRNNITFDEIFRFHYYDMDICRQFEAKNLTLGTWPLAAIHHSKGTLLNQEFNESRSNYINKWKE